MLVSKNPGVFHGTQPRLWVIAKSSREVKQFVITRAAKNPHNGPFNDFTDLTDLIVGAAAGCDLLILFF
jgi:hypothetical protein